MSCFYYRLIDDYIWQGNKKNLSGLKKQTFYVAPIGSIRVNLLEPLFIVITLQVGFHSSLFREVFNDNLIQRVVWVFHTRYSHGASFLPEQIASIVFRYFAKSRVDHRITFYRSSIKFYIVIKHLFDFTFSLLRCQLRTSFIVIQLH